MTALATKSSAALGRGMYGEDTLLQDFLELGMTGSAAIASASSFANLIEREDWLNAEGRLQFLAGDLQAVTNHFAARCPAGVGGFHVQSKAGY